MSYDNKHQSIFDIRYVKLHFKVEFVESTTVPRYKASALRGGMGEMLLRSNCVRDRKCESCDFEPECIVRRIMYSKMEIQPTFMTSGDSVGYVIECEDYREEFKESEQMEFSVILLGKTIVYFSQILNAFYALGMSGLGKEGSRFRIVSVTNSMRKPIMDGNDINMGEYRIRTVGNYIEYRRSNMENSSIARIKFQSPLSVKYRQKILKELRIDATLESAARRVYILDCYEGIDSNLTDRSYLDSLPVPEMKGEQHRQVRVRRYSNHQKSAMYLEGIEGEMELGSISDEVLAILLAGELLHIGKNTSFGFGRYRIL